MAVPKENFGFKRMRRSHHRLKSANVVEDKKVE